MYSKDTRYTELNAYRLNAAMYQICHCEAVGRGNLQHGGLMTDAPINIEIMDLQC